jgi:hypothetical protein
MERHAESCSLPIADRARYQSLSQSEFDVISFKTSFIIRSVPRSTLYLLYLNAQSDGYEISALTVS